MALSGYGFSQVEHGAKMEDLEAAGKGQKAFVAQVLSSRLLPHYVRFLFKFRMTGQGIDDR